MSFVRPEGKEFRVFHCSCWGDEQAACEVNIMVDDTGRITAECTNCGQPYELTTVAEEAARGSCTREVVWISGKNWK